LVKTVKGKAIYIYMGLS